MSTEIPTHHVEMYRSNVIMLAQQKGSRLRRTCREDGDVVGKATYYDRIGAVTASKNNARHSDTPLTDTPHSRRKAFLHDFDWADLVDHFDKLKMIYAPESRYAINGAWAMGRSMDDEIVLASDANAAEGVDGSTSTALPASQIVASGSTGLTIAKLLTAKEILDAAEVDPDYRRYAAVSAKQITDLLNTTEVTSADYNTVKALAEGKVDSFMGFEFIRTERLKLNTADRRCLFYTEAAFGLEVADDDVTADIGPRRDKRNSIQVYVKMSIGAVRIEDAQMVAVDCRET